MVPSAEVWLFSSSVVRAKGFDTEPTPSMVPRLAIVCWMGPSRSATVCPAGARKTTWALVPARDGKSAARISSAASESEPGME